MLDGKQIEQNAVKRNPPGWTKGKPKSAETREKMRFAALNNIATMKHIAKLVEGNRVVFTPDMTAALIEGLSRGLSQPMLVKKIGVCTELIRRETRRMGLKAAGHSRRRKDQYYG